jgi:hypothetical protein
LVPLGRLENSDSYEAMFLYHRAEWGVEGAGSKFEGMMETSSKLTTVQRLEDLDIGGSGDKAVLSVLAPASRFVNRRRTKQ